MKLKIISNSDWEQLFRKVQKESSVRYVDKKFDIIIRTVEEDGVHYTNEYEYDKYLAMGLNIKKLAK